MTGSPTLTVKLGDGAGAFPYDITQYVEVDQGVTWARGRPDEFTSNSPGQMTLTLDNTDGRFTFGSTSGGYGAINLDRPIRLSRVLPSNEWVNLLSAESSSFEGGTVGAWGTANGAAIANSALHPSVGTKGVQITWPTGGIPAMQQNVSGFVVGQTYTFSIDYFVTAGQPNIQLQVFGITTGSALTTKGSIASASITFVATSTSHFVQILGSGTTAGNLAFVDNVKVYQSAVNRFTGRVQEWPVGWPGGGDKFSYVTVTAVDDLARLARRTLRSSLEEEVLLDSPTAYYTLGEATGATAAVDTSGLLAPSLTTAGTGTAVVFGNGTGPADGLTAAQFAGGQYLSGNYATPPLPATWSVEFWMLKASAPATSEVILNLSSAGALGVTVTITTSGVIGGVVAGSVVNVADGRTHHVVITYNGTTRALFVDGVADGTTSPSATNLDGLTLGGPPVAGFFNAFTGTISHLSLYSTALSTTRIGQHYTAGSADFLGETPTARITRIAAYSGASVGSIDPAGTTTMGLARQQGSFAADVLSSVSDATFGTVYIDGNGAISSVTGYTITQQLFPSASLDAQWAEDGTQVQTDKSYLGNRLTGKATGSANIAAAIDDLTSIASFGVYPQDYEWNVATDDQARDRTTWRLYLYSQPTSRIPGLNVNVMQMDATTAATAQSLELGSFFRILNWPSQTPGGDQYLIVQSIGETVTESEWTLNINADPHRLTAAWILEDSFFGVLGASTKLYGA